MWNSVLLDDNNKWSTTSTASFAKTLSVTDESADVDNLPDSDDVYDWTRLSSSNDVVTVQQTNYVDWNGRRDEDDDDDTVDFFHNFVGKFFLLLFLIPKLNYLFFCPFNNKRKDIKNRPRQKKIK